MSENQRKYGQAVRRMLEMAEKLYNQTRAQVAVVIYSLHGQLSEYATPSLGQVVEHLEYEPSPSPAVLLERVTAMDLQELSDEQLLQLNDMVKSILEDVEKERITRVTHLHL